MSSNTKPVKRWIKWTLGTILGLLFLVLSGIGYYYYQVKSISLEDTKERHSSGSTTQSADSAEKEVPRALDGAADTKNQIQNTYNSKLSALQADCAAKSKAVLSELISEIKQKQANGEQISADLLQNTYLPMIVSSESHCDQQFFSMLVDAKKEYEEAGLNPGMLDAWQFNYNAAKEQARSRALSQLSSLIAEK